MVPRKSRQVPTRDQTLGLSRTHDLSRIVADAEGRAAERTDGLGPETLLAEIEEQAQALRECDD